MSYYKFAYEIGALRKKEDLQGAFKMSLQCSPQNFIQGESDWMGPEWEAEWGKQWVETENT